MTIPKKLLCLAGEHRVASELCKLGVFATITPGNRKQTDLYAINDVTKRSLRIEVKTSQGDKFVTGSSEFVNSVSQKKTLAPDFWVLVLIKPGGERFFVLSHKEFETLQNGVSQAYFARYRARHNGKEFTGRGVDNLSVRELESKLYESRWDKIKAALENGQA